MKVSLALTRPAFPLPVAPVWSGGPWAFSPDASNPAVASDARQGWGRITNTSPELTVAYMPILQSVSSLVPCDLDVAGRVAPAHCCAGAP